MKKINLILGAVAAVALLASCSNETPKEWTNVKNHDYKYAYTVTGSMTTTNKSGNSTAVSTNKTVATIKNAVANISYDEDALDSSNYEDYSISIAGNADYVNTYTAAGATTASPSTKYTDKFGSVRTWTEWEPVYIHVEAGWYSIAQLASITSYEDLANLTLTPFSTDRNDGRFDPNDSAYDSTLAAQYIWQDEIDDSYDVPVTHSRIDDLSIAVQDFGGDYFISFDNEYIALPEDAFDGFIGDDEFTLKYSTKKDNRSYLSQAGYENAAGNVDTTEIEYSFTFKKVNLAD